MINKYNKYIFDLDGTLYRGDNVIPGASEVVNEIKKQGKKILFISNKTTGSVSDYISFMKQNGFNVDESEMITSGNVIRGYLIKHHAGSCFYMIGEERFINELIEAGLNYSEKPGEIQIVIVTLDRTVSNFKIDIAAGALRDSALFYAANIDRTCPVENGEIPDAGDTIEILEKMTSRKLEKNFGKPSLFMIEEIIRKFNDDMSNCLLIGDRLETDIKMGNILGIDTAHVATGISGSNLIEGINPTYKINSIAALLNHF